MIRLSRYTRAGLALSIGAVVLAFAWRPATRATQDTTGETFWGIEAVFEHTRGVVSAVSGYGNGDIPNPSYRQVTTGRTGYAESVQVTYDPGQVNYEQLLQVFFAVHDPTQLNRQGPDVGSSYRSAIFYLNEGQKRAAEAYIAQLTAEERYEGDIVTEVEPLENFYEAEAYHQNYLARHPNQPYIVRYDLPKLEYLKENFPSLWREERTN